MAYTFLRDNPYEIINVLFGYGGNGKGVFTGVLTSLHGAQNVSNVPLRAMIHNPFALSDLEGKSVNIEYLGLPRTSMAEGHRGYSGKMMFTWVGAAVDIPHKVHKYLGTLGPKLYFLRLPNP